MNLTDKQRESLIDLAECQGQIDIDNFTVVEKAIMLELVQLRLVALRFVILPAGKETVKNG